MSEMSDKKKDEMGEAMMRYGALKERERIKEILAKQCLPKQYEKIINEIGIGIE